MNELLFEKLTEQRIITKQEALDFICDLSNPKESREKISDLLKRYERAQKKYPGAHFVMSIKPMGKCSLWM